MKCGAELDEEGVRYCVWSPHASRVAVEIEPGDGEPKRVLPLIKDGEGYHWGQDGKGKAGDAYGFRLEGGNKLPDPNSRAQRDDVHGSSQVVDPRAYSWSDGDWVRPPFRDLVLYELHVGTFTAEGTFLAAMEKLPHLAELGITAIELMPIADFPGTRNWGYDGVLIYAPARCYGTPDDLRAFVDAAHRHGLAVVLDVVYNHFGPDGNYLSTYSPLYFSRRHHTPWGDGFNFDAESCQPVRRFFGENPIYWMEEYHIDGFRFDATHEIRDDTHPSILAEITAAIHARGGYAIAEDSRNESHVISPQGFDFDAVWADDFHHAVRVNQTNERFSYFQDFTGTAEQVKEVLQRGWLYRGQLSSFLGAARGSECDHLPTARFVHCISNHDQTGNRAMGERLHHLIPDRAYRALSTLLCLTPYTPMLFMGQEWAASTPFLFFTDHNAELGALITQGRRKEFSSFPEFSDGAQIPDPQADATFQHSKLNWQELREPLHLGVLKLYRECLHLRRGEAVFRPVDRKAWSIRRIDETETLLLTNPSFSLFVNLRGTHSLPLKGAWDLVLSSEEARFGGSGRLSWEPRESIIHFNGSETLLFRRIFPY